VSFLEASVYATKRMDSQARRALGLRVLTMRFWPRGIMKSEIDIWLPDAGPSAALLAARRSGVIAWEEFVTRYLAEQDHLVTCRVVTYETGLARSDEQRAQSPDEVLRELERQYGVVTILCWEGKGKNCHRHILLAWPDSWRHNAARAPDSSLQPGSFSLSLSK
jgi:uncharacterized protein YeaO (DUF488 family)